MEIRDLITDVSKSYKKILIFTVIGFGIGLIYFLLPKKYIATGSFIVSRRPETSYSYFSYEGYYSQQNAINFADTLRGVMESTDILKETLLRMNITASEKNIKKYANLRSVEKESPQMLVLETKGKNEEQARKYWNNMAESANRIVDGVNQQAKEYIVLQALTAEPVVRKEYNSALFALYGAITGAFVGVSEIVIKKYLLAKN